MNYTKLARSRNFIISFFTTNSRRPTHAIMKSRLQTVNDIIEILTVPKNGTQIKKKDQRSSALIRVLSKIFGILLESILLSFDESLQGQQFSIEH